jgi:CubicO group peptidase (beta-lactamase class C family)
MCDSDVFDDIRGLIRLKLAENVVPSLAVAVAKDGQIIWEEGFGWADRENRVPADEHTIYPLASISKPFTATGLMILEERGRIDLDSSINEYLGEAKLKAWVGDPDEATVRRVANHSSGLPFHFNYFYGDEPNKSPTMEETIRRYGNLVFPSMERCQYANLGYGILGYVISRLSDESYSNFMREAVFLPLGLEHTSVLIDSDFQINHAERYGSDGLPLPFTDCDTRGAAAVYSSAHDLVRFGMFHLKECIKGQRAIISEETINNMQEPTSAKLVHVGPWGTYIEEKVGYGIGWRISKEERYETTYHDGGMSGASTQLILVPSEKLVIVVLCNMFQPRLTDLIVKEIKSVTLPGYKVKFDKEVARERAVSSTPKIKLDPVLIGKWIGSVHTYKAEIPLILWFQESGEAHVKMGDQPKAMMNRAIFDKGYLWGAIEGSIGTGDVNRFPPSLNVELKLRGYIMNGVTSAICISTPKGRMGYALSHWTELKKEND